MLHMVVMRASIVAMGVFSTSVAFSQVDSGMINLRKYIEKAEKEKGLLTHDENKLAGSLYDLLRLAEQADTSAQKKAELTKRLKESKYLHPDRGGRVKVDVELISANGADEIADSVRSFGGRVEHIGLAPYIECRISPKKLRNLISIPSIRLIKEEIPGTINSYRVR